MNNNDEIKYILINFCKNNKVDSINFLLYEFSKLNINFQYLFNGLALLYACIYNKKDIVRTILEKNICININIQDEKQFTPLIYLCRYNQIENIKLLLTKKDININIQDKDKYTALMEAYENSNPEVIKILLNQKDININIQNKNGHSALLISCIDYLYNPDNSINNIVLFMLDCRTNIKNIFIDAPPLNKILIINLFSKIINLIINDDKIEKKKKLFILFRLLSNNLLNTEYIFNSYNQIKNEGIKLLKNEKFLILCADNIPFKLVGKKKNFLYLNN